MKRNIGMGFLHSPLALINKAISFVTILHPPTTCSTYQYLQLSCPIEMIYLFTKFNSFNHEKGQRKNQITMKANAHLQ